mmetsp:Transcript_29646/g.64149  ORF Transcript_29646/g.64149 Transcript_29646/m.64149 type:complete len:258 (-) Transcript_29646:119-892(-)
MLPHASSLSSGEVSLEHGHAVQLPVGYQRPSNSYLACRRHFPISMVDTTKLRRPGCVVPVPHTATEEQIQRSQELSKESCLSPPRRLTSGISSPGEPLLPPQRSGQPMPFAGYSPSNRQSDMGESSYMLQFNEGMQSSSDAADYEGASPGAWIQHRASGRVVMQADAVAPSLGGVHDMGPPPFSNYSQRAIGEHGYMLSAEAQLDDEGESPGAHIQSRAAQAELMRQQHCHQQAPPDSGEALLVPGRHHPYHPTLGP